jgi:hypothetical protein
MSRSTSLRRWPTSSLVPREHDLTRWVCRLQPARPVRGTLDGGLHGQSPAPVGSAGGDHDEWGRTARRGRARHGRGAPAGSASPAAGARSGAAARAPRLQQIRPIHLSRLPQHLGGGRLGLQVTPGGVTQALARAARRAAPTYQALVGGVRASPVVAPRRDRLASGWAQGVAVGVRRPRRIVYRIAAGRGLDNAAVVLGHYAGVLERDGWRRTAGSSPHRIRPAWRNLLRRCHELLTDAQPGQAKTPHAVRHILQHAVAVRDPLRYTRTVGPPWPDRSGAEHPALSLQPGVRRCAAGRVSSN